MTQGSVHELWQPIIGFDNYLVSNFGRIKSLKYNKILKKHYGSCGYLNVFLYNLGKKYTKKIHRLVAQHFIENIYQKPQVNHIDGNKHNNYILNLEWVTNGENLKHAFKNGLKSNVGENNPNAKLTDKEVREIQRLLGNHIKINQISKLYNISRRVIFRIQSGERKVNENC